MYLTLPTHRAQQAPIARTEKENQDLAPRFLNSSGRHLRFQIQVVLTTHRARRVQ